MRVLVYSIKIYLPPIYFENKTPNGIPLVLIRLLLVLELGVY